MFQGQHLEILSIGCQVSTDGSASPWTKSDWQAMDLNYLREEKNVSSFLEWEEELTKTFFDQTVDMLLWALFLTMPWPPSFLGLQSSVVGKILLSQFRENPLLLMSDKNPQPLLLTPNHFILKLHTAETKMHGLCISEITNNYDYHSYSTRWI